MANEGYIKLYRRMMKWGWYTDTPTKCVFLHLLFLACYEPCYYKCVHLEPGQAVASIRQISTDTGISVQSVRTALNHLKSTQEITQCEHGKFSVFTVNNYADYQDANTVSNKQLTQNQHSANTDPNIKKVRSKEYIATTAASDAGCDLYNQDLSDCIQCYEQNCGSIPRAVSDEIKAALQKFPAAIICQAIEEAAVHNSRRWSYISQILARCEQEGIYTVEAFKAKRDSAKAARTAPRQTDAAAAMERLKQLAKGVTADD